MCLLPPGSLGLTPAMLQMVPMLGDDVMGQLACRRGVGWVAPEMGLAVANKAKELADEVIQGHSRAFKGIQGHSRACEGL